MTDTQGPLAGRTLLIVEDEMLVALMLEEMLRELGCHVAATASSVRSALAAAESKPLDGAVLDVNLGGEPVYPVARRLKDLGVPFVFSSGYAQADIDPAFASVPLIRKPYRLSTVESTLVRTFLGG